MWGGATFDTAMRFLKEDPWERLAQLRGQIPNILLPDAAPRLNAVGYANYPDNVVQAFVKEAAAAGIDIFRIFDSLNWVDDMRVRWRRSASRASCGGGHLLHRRHPGSEPAPSTPWSTTSTWPRSWRSGGAHILGIKDMAGLLKPYAARKLIKALKEEVGMPIHFHTHDTGGDGAATRPGAAEAGVDIVDGAIASMSGLTCQPSLNALVAALQGSERDTGLDLAALQRARRLLGGGAPLYAPFEIGPEAPARPRCTCTRCPAGSTRTCTQQARRSGLGDRWHEVSRRTPTANQLFGDIVKVTPSSKAVGDLALFMVQNNLDEDDLDGAGGRADFPDSVITSSKAMHGPAHGRLPKELQRKC